MKKVLLVATVQSHICQFHKPLVEILKNNGYEIHVAARNNLAEKNGLKLDFVDKVFDVPFERSPFSIKNFKAYKLLKKLIYHEKYKIISCNTPVGGFLSRIAAIKARKKGTKIFYTAHGFHFYKGAPKKNWILYYPIEWFCSLFTDVLITINEEDFSLAKKRFMCKVERIHGVGVDSERYCPALDDEKIEIRKELGFKEEEKIILCVGELLPNKNQSMLIDAMKNVTQKFPEAKVILAGNGPEKENLEKRAIENGVEEKIVFLGYCTTLEKYQKIADVSVSCSKREGLGLNLIEAMLSGNPIVATSNRGHKELVIQGENGFLIDLGNTKELVDRIILILSDSEKAKEMGEKGIVIGTKYCIDEVKKELDMIYFL